MRRTLTAILLTLSAGSLNAQTAWSNPAGGDWMTPANWDAMQVPDAPDVTVLITLDGTYDVLLDAPGAGVGVLAIASPDARLIITPDARLTLHTTLNSTGNGTGGLIEISPDHASLHAAGIVTVGDGDLRLNGGSATISAEHDARFILGARTRVLGGGTITADIHASGQLRADMPDSPLVLTGAPKAFDGFAFIDPDCTLALRDATFDLTGAGLTTYEGHIDISNANITGGGFDTVAFATMHISGETSFDGTTLLGNAGVVAGGTLALRGDLVNHGHLSVNPDRTNPPAGMRIETANARISGFGQITLVSPGTRIEGEAFINGTGHHLTGVGHIAAPMTNQGHVVPGVGAHEIGSLTASAPIDSVPGAIYRFDVASDGVSDRIESTSTFHAAGTLWIELAEDLTATDDWSATVVSAQGGVTGRFLQILGPFPAPPGRIIRARYLPDAIIIGSACVADYDLSGSLNFFDVAEFVALFNADQADADLAAPFGVWNFFDVAAFVDAYVAGCP